jgi:hypothetical protein
MFIDHVGLVDALPSRDRRTVEHLAVFENVIVDRMRGHGYMLFFAFRIRETKVDKFDLFLFKRGHYVCGTHGFPPVLQLQDKVGAQARPVGFGYCTMRAKMGQHTRCCF